MGDSLTRTSQANKQWTTIFLTMSLTNVELQETDPEVERLEPPITQEAPMEEAVQELPVEEQIPKKCFFPSSPPQL
eukprot:3744580-Amphidinium_carterae.2